MLLAIQNFSLPIIVQSDSSEALSYLSVDGLVRSTYGHLVAEIKELMRERVFIPSKLTRDQNRVADDLANYSRIELPIVWQTIVVSSVPRLCGSSWDHHVSRIF